MRLSELAKVINGQLHGYDREYHGRVNTDTRHLQPGEIFFALQGDNFDGHDFIAEAESAGAAAAVVAKAVSTKLPSVMVADTTTALADLAKYHRRQFNCPFIAVTGSCGKTTSKMLMASVFAQCGNVLANPASYNNAIGVPLTLLQLTKEHDYVVTELGANHPGEIALLSHLVQPQVAIITNAASVHLEGFGDIAGVARTKGEIFQSLPADGIAIINTDDAQADFWRQLLTTQRAVSFGILHSADIMAKDITLDSQGQPKFLLLTPQGECHIHLPLMGQHNVYNALVAAAAAYVLQIDLTAIRQGLENAQAVNKRLVEHKGKAGAIIIDDTYNANPASMLAAIQLLTQRSQRGILVMGDMLELGKETDVFHQQVGIQAKQYGVQQLFCLGKHSEQAAQAFGVQGFSFKTHNELIDALKPYLQQEVIVLVKGSRGMLMEKIVAAISEDAH